MNFPNFFEPKNSLKLYGLQESFIFLSNLYLNQNLPRVLMFTGNKGNGKSTLVNHFLNSIFDSKNYDNKNYLISEKSIFYKQYKNNIFSNIIYINGSDFKSVKVDDIRTLKSKIFQSTILTKDRFIILDDVELFNHNSLNALLKVIEEPTKNNYFFLINNKSKSLLQTIKSRAIEVKIILNDNKRLEIIKNLIETFNLKLVLDPRISQLSPGNFVKFNYLCNEYKISPTDDLVHNYSILLNYYKKNKDILFMNLAFFLTDYYFYDLNKNNILKSGKIFETKNYIYDNLNNFLKFNISQNALLNAINLRLNNE